MSNLADAALGATPEYPVCPLSEFLPHFHNTNVCDPDAVSPYADRDLDRAATYARLIEGGSGATLVPNQLTLTCPMEVQSLENPLAVRGFDTKWIVENDASTPVVVAWVVGGIEYSPFHPDITPPQNDPDAILQPGQWKSVPAYESFVYHVRELTDEGPGDILLQHRAGLVPLGNPNNLSCDASKPDVEPVDPVTAQRKAAFARTPTHQVRHCNTIDIGFRNQLGCPLHVYWAGNLGADVPDFGFTCGEKFKFHLGIGTATQDFMHDWQSATKFEGSFIGHTFVARLASNPSIVVDSYTIRPTRIMDCSNKKKQRVPPSSHPAEAVVEADGAIIPEGEGGVDEGAASVGPVENNNVLVGPSFHSV